MAKLDERATIRPPEVGEIIYVPGGDDHWAGLAEVDSVYEQESPKGVLAHFVETKQTYTSYRWEGYLDGFQINLKKHNVSWATLERPTGLSHYSISELQEEIYRRERLKFYEPS